MRLNETEHTKITEHNHVPNPDKTISMEFMSKITSSAATCHDPPRRIIHEALLNVDKENGRVVSNYSSSQRIIEQRMMFHCQGQLHSVKLLLLMNSKSLTVITTFS